MMKKSKSNNTLIANNHSCSFTHYHSYYMQQQGLPLSDNQVHELKQSQQLVPKIPWSFETTCWLASFKGNPFTRCKKKKKQKTSIFSGIFEPLRSSSSCSSKKGILVASLVPIKSQR